MVRSEDVWGSGVIREALADFDEVTDAVDAGATDPFRLPRSVRRVLSRWRALHPEDDLEVSVFFLSAVPDGDLIQEQGSFRAHRLHSGEVSPNGRIWFVGVAARSGTGVPLPSSDSAEAAIEFLLRFPEIRDVPCALIDPVTEGGELCLYPNGLADLDSSFDAPLFGAVSYGEIEKLVSRAHSEYLESPRQVTSDVTLWANGEQYRPHKKAEMRVQSVLVPVLGFAFEGVFAEPERDVKSGRYDIALRTRLDGQVRALAIIELKVVRSQSDSGKTKYSNDEAEAWLTKGVVQAYSYAADEGCSISACLWWDLREPDAIEELPMPVERARDLSVEICGWRCFGNWDDYRDAIAERWND